VPRKKIQLREVGGFLATLEEAGARDVRRAQVDPSGMVEIRWRLSPEDEARDVAVARAARTPIILSAIFAVVVIAALILAVY